MPSISSVQIAPGDKLFKISAVLCLVLGITVLCLASYWTDVIRNTNTHEYGGVKGSICERLESLEDEGSLQQTIEEIFNDSKQYEHWYDQSKLVCAYWVGFSNGLIVAICCACTQTILGVFCILVEFTGIMRPLKAMAVLGTKILGHSLVLLQSLLALGYLWNSSGFVDYGEQTATNPNVSAIWCYEEVWCTCDGCTKHSRRSLLALLLLDAIYALASIILIWIYSCQHPRHSFHTPEPEIEPPVKASVVETKVETRPSNAEPVVSSTEQQESERDSSSDDEGLVETLRHLITAKSAARPPPTKKEAKSKKKASKAKGAKKSSVAKAGSEGSKRGSKQAQPKGKSRPSRPSNAAQSQ